MTPEEEASDAISIGIVPVFNHFTFVLFDTGLTFSYKSTYFTISFDSTYDSLSMSTHVSTLIGYSLVVNRVYQYFMVTFVCMRTG